MASVVNSYAYYHCHSVMGIVITYSFDKHVSHACMCRVPPWSRGAGSENGSVSTRVLNNPSHTCFTGIVLHARCNDRSSGAPSLARDSPGSSCLALRPQTLSALSQLGAGEAHAGLLGKPGVRASWPASWAPAPRPRVWGGARLAQSSVGRRLCAEDCVVLPGRLPDLPGRPPVSPMPSP